jgi:2-polyprenyl-3-methyl-5-hydroxy-6-metoxy-1,4-benzoquinol methylase
VDVEETISHYDETARHYATLIDDQPPGWIADALGRLRARVVPDAPILEIGSGVGRDASWLEARGTQVRRTDATPEFREIQRERGHHVDLLNVVSDDLGGPYGGALAMAVLMHIPRTSIGDVLAKLAASLLSGAPLLVCTREGAGRGSSARSRVRQEGELENATSRLRSKRSIAFSSPRQATWKRSSTGSPVCW